MVNNMKIYYYGFFNAGGGLENFAKRMITFYKKKGADVCLLVINDKFSYKDYFLSIGCEYFVLPNWAKKPFSYSKIIGSILHKSNKETDVIHLNLCSMRNYPLLKSCKKSGLKTIITSHYSKIKFGRGLLLHLLNKRLFKKLGIKTAVSKEAYNFMFPRTKHPIIIRNSIPSSKYSFDTEKRFELRKRMGINENDFAIIQVGRLFKDKNPVFSLMVFIELQKQFNNLKLFYVGSETEKDTRKIVEEKSIKNVFFVGKIDENLEDWYSAGDALFFPSLNEAASLTLLEAMSNGIDIFCSKNVPLPTIDAKNVTSLDLKVNAWCNCLIQLLNNYNGRIRKNWIIGTEYDGDATEKKYWSLYENNKNR